jgi:hypothetical protein
MDIFTPLPFQYNAGLIEWRWLDKKTWRHKVHISQGEVKLRPTVSRPLSWWRAPAWNLLPDCSFLSDSCGFLDVEHPLWREHGSVIYLYSCFWTLSEQLLWVRVPQKSTIFYCLIWDSPNLEGQVPVFISPGNRVAQLYPRALGSLFVASYDSQGYGGGILTRFHTG